MTVKVTLIFSAFRYSWAEAHYDISDTSFTAAIPSAAQLAKLRQDCLGKYASLDTVRLSHYPSNRLTFDVPRSAWPGMGQIQSSTGGEETSTDSPFSAILMSMNTSTAHRSLYLAGAPDVDVQWTPSSPDGYLPSGPFNANVIAYMQNLIGVGSFASWGTRVDASNLGTQVTAVQNQIGFGNDVGVLTAANPGLIVGKPAKLFGFRTINPRLPNLSGSYDVLAVLPPGSGSSSWTTILARTQGVEGTNFSVYGTIVEKAYQVEAYTDWSLVRVTHRKRGASYGRPLGKSSARR